MLNLRLSWAVMFVAAVSCFFPFFPQFVADESVGSAVRTIEHSQATLLLIFGLFTLAYMRPWEMPIAQKKFWFWAVCWWLVLFGRSTSWGRDYFPEVPKIYFRAISIVLIASVIFPLFSATLRHEIHRKLKTTSIPFWALLLAFAGLSISDAIEHLRMIHTWFVSDLKYQTFMEELYEYTLILGLFLTAWPFMQQDATQHLGQLYKRQNQHDALQSKP